MRREALEDALVSLSLRIARSIVMVGMVAYVLPEKDKQGRMVLDRDQINLAVEEILGTAWFDLPLDWSNRLKAWTVDEVLKPDDEMEGSEVFSSVFGNSYNQVKTARSGAASTHSISPPWHHRAQPIDKDPPTCDERHEDASQEALQLGYGHLHVQGLRWKRYAGKLTSRIVSCS